MRKGSVTRKTKETNIKVELELDGSGQASIATGIPFFDHMLELFTKHSGFDLELSAEGDLQVDAHHTVEDTGIALGEALAQALGEKRGIIRYGSSILPMDEALVMTALDLSGRYFYALQANYPSGVKEGLPNFVIENDTGQKFDVALTEEFLKALAMNGKMNLHIKVLEGSNLHHIVEGVFKSLGRALKIATGQTGSSTIPSTKGIL